MDVDLLLTVLRAFAQHGLAYRIVGGVALNLQGLPRNTVRLQDRADAARLKQQFALDDEDD